ncbi:hypothetical protein K438DRAFT_1767848 [Mycena galopus ATCC 62051]|nr:hypothetical protein K438DRAFT_1767848 [Mycena galopus ATCC 62051]
MRTVGDIADGELSKDDSSPPKSSKRLRKSELELLTRDKDDATTVHQSNIGGSLQSAASRLSSIHLISNCPLLRRISVAATSDLSQRSRLKVADLSRVKSSRDGRLKVTRVNLSRFRGVTITYT